MEWDLFAVWDGVVGRALGVYGEDEEAGLEGLKISMRGKRSFSGKNGKKCLLFLDAEGVYDLAIKRSLHWQGKGSQG